MDKRILNNLVAKLANADLCESSKNDKLSFLIRELVANLETEKEIESVLEILHGPDEPIEFTHGAAPNSNLKHLGNRDKDYLYGEKSGLSINMNKENRILARIVISIEQERQ